MLLMRKFQVIWLSLLTLLCWFGGATVARAELDNHAKLISIDVPRYMISGERYTVRLEYKNAGAAVWSVEQNYQIAWASPELEKSWGKLKKGNVFETPVAPGEVAMIEFDIRAPKETGEMRLGWQLLDPQGNYFGEPAVVKKVRVESQKNQARVVMQLVPDEISTGEQFTAVIQVKNIGRTTWNRDSGYHLAAIESNAWNIKRIDLPANAHIAPDETVTFKARVRAPQSTGEYRFQWQMRQNNTYFGDNTPMVNVRVGNQHGLSADAEFVYQEVGQTMLAGEVHGVVIQFKNVSRSSWRQGEVFLANPDRSGLLWAVDVVEMNPREVIKPGEFLSFRFNVQAPTEPGLYPFQWQLRHTMGGLFGQPSEKLMVDVR